MRIAAKIGIDILALGITMVIGLFIGALVRINNPECNAVCSSQIANTFWLPAFLAFQPVLWTKGIGKLKRIGIWLIAIIFGGIIYLLTEFILYQLGIGFKPHLSMGYTSIFPYSYDIAAVAISILGVKYLNKSANIKTGELI